MVLTCNALIFLPHLNFLLFVNDLVLQNHAPLYKVQNYRPAGLPDHDEFVVSA